MNAHVDRDRGGRLGAHDVLKRGEGGREHGQTEGAPNVAERRTDVGLGLAENARHAEHHVERDDTPHREGDGVELVQLLALLGRAPAVVDDVVHDPDDFTKELGAEEREPAICRVAVRHPATVPITNFSLVVMSQREKKRRKSGSWAYQRWQFTTMVMSGSSATSPMLLLRWTW
ncbi:unnamed protein product [Phytophthora fragariaefolia]|uniref:Unnamed protein product n=1 Tax=Phytophthora fragariaefolia TaxID=1490495 RepID=A0A9W6XLF1_9STRA|nr:unnamed protein product [Phytophthora fragariaefolia]